MKTETITHFSFLYPPLLENTNLFSVSVSLWVLLLLDFTYKRDHLISVSLYLTYLT